MSKKLKFASICLVFIIIASSIVKITLGIENEDLFRTIISKTNSVPVESGITLYYDMKSDGKNESINWLKAMNLYDRNASKVSNEENYSEDKLMKTPSDINSSNNSNTSKGIKNNITIDDGTVYCREFEKGKIYGYIESRKSNEGAKVSIYIRQLSDKNEIYNLERKINSSISNNSYNMLMYKYIKVKIGNKDISEVQQNILNILSSHKAQNVNTVSINRGYSTVAYLRKYTPVSDDGKFIDFNFAVLKGTEDTYVILGTPIIDITY